ncbi:MAG: diguanylate cyclase [Butyrivibrio sp.]|nr:diguanylate cyclase [Butyrivibrio sp.]
MKSIQEKITALITVAILMVAMSVGVTAAYSLRQAGEYDSARILNLTCEKGAANINNRLLSTEEAVQILADYALERLFSVEKLAGDEAYRDSYTVQLANLFGNIANNVPGSTSYYVRFNPDIMPADSGLYYEYNSEENAFYPENPADLSIDETSADQSATWWLETTRNGAPTWIDPYYSEKREGQIISYVIPLYEGNVLVGVAGMDIDFNEIIEDVKNVKIYETGYGALIDDDGTVLYNPSFESGSTIDEMGFAKDTSFADESNGTEPISYEIGGIKKEMVYTALINEMRLIITAPVSEINATSNGLVRQALISTVLILMTFLILTVMVSRRVTGPLKDLANVARQINEGNLEVTFPKETKDEVGELTHAMEKMVHHLKHHIDGLNSLAYHDALTGVKNKTAYDDATTKLDNQEGEKEYGLVVLDANNLKKINDTYGHERGNIYLQNACKLTCRIFKGSPVFRVGGDEFVVILQGDDYDNCYKLMRDFDTEAEKHNTSTDNAWEKINIAKGMVKYDPETDKNAESVFKRADARMYVAKQKMKLAEIG